MKIPASVMFTSVTALGVALIAGLAFAPPSAAQEQTTNRLDRMEQEIDPPPPIDMDDQTPVVDTTRTHMDWKQLDSDGDGRISRSEGSVDPDFDRNFEMMDTDSDGYITGSEMDDRDPTGLSEPEEDDEQR